MSEATRDSRLVLRSEDLEWRLVDGHVVAFDLSGQAYFATNASGAVLWSGLHAGATREELVELLRARYGLTAGDAERDVDAFIEHLVQRDLLDSSS